MKIEYIIKNRNEKLDEFIGNKRIPSKGEMVKYKLNSYVVDNIITDIDKCVISIELSLLIIRPFEKDFYGL